MAHQARDQTVSASEDDSQSLPLESHPQGPAVSGPEKLQLSAGDLQHEDLQLQGARHKLAPVNTTCPANVRSLIALGISA